MKAKGDGQPRIFVRAKSNIGPDGGGIAYTIDVKDIGDGIESPVTTWLHQIDGDAAMLIEGVEVQADGERPSALSEAASFLHEMLSEGPRSAAQIFAEAEQRGVSEKTLRRAKAQLGIKARKGGLGQGWAWEMPTT